MKAKLDTAMMIAMVLVMILVIVLGMVLECTARRNTAQDGADAGGTE